MNFHLLVSNGSHLRKAYKKLLLFCTGDMSISHSLLIDYSLLLVLFDNLLCNRMWSMLGGLQVNRMCFTGALSFPSPTMSLNNEFARYAPPKKRKLDENEFESLNTESLIGPPPTPLRVQRERRRGSLLLSLFLLLSHHNLQLVSFFEIKLRLIPPILI